MSGTKDCYALISTLKKSTVIFRIRLSDVPTSSQHKNVFDHEHFDQFTVMYGLQLIYRNSYTLALTYSSHFDFLTGDPCSSLEQPINLSGYVGTFNSVNYPNDYVLDGNCQWRITAASIDMASVVVLNI